MRELNKRGLSSIITTILLIMLIIIAIGAVWITINNLLTKSSEGISLDSFTIDLEIVSAKINFSDGETTLRVRRNSGEGELTGIKFLVEDSLGSDIFERKFESFGELEERTFILDLTESEFLLLYDINKISIIPIYKSESGATELIGAVSDSVEGLNKEIDNPREVAPEEELRLCTSDAGCPADTPIIGTEVCNSEITQVIETITTWSCLIEAGVCINDFASQIKTICKPEEYCFDGECVPDTVICTPETVAENCGTDSLVGNLECSVDRKDVVQGFKTYSCPSGVCESVITEQFVSSCSDVDPTYECVLGVCIDVPECTSDADCLPEEFCNLDLLVCELELPLNTGYVDIVFPPVDAEYFTSPDLPKENTNGNYGNNYIIFPDSAEDRCLPLAGHFFPEENSTYPDAYVKIGVNPTNITTGTYYEIWQRDYICSVPSYYL